MKIKTSILRNMLNQVAKSIKQDKLYPLTALIAMEASNGKLSIMGSDGANYVISKTEELIEDGLECVVQTETIQKLINTVTTDEVTLTAENLVLTVKANGKYNIELPPDETGKPIKYPMFKYEEGFLSKEVVKRVEYDKTLKYNGIAVGSPQIGEGKLHSYYQGYGSVVTGDGGNIALSYSHLCDNKLSLTPDTVRLVTGFKEDDITLAYGKDHSLLYSTDTFMVYIKGYAPDFPFDDVKPVLDISYPSMCKVSRSELSGAIRRMQILKSKFDINTATLKFNCSGVVIEDGKGKSEEKINYIESNNPVDFKFVGIIDKLKQILSTIVSDTVIVEYGLKGSIVFCNDEVKIITGEYSA